jgi:hypothetical protein
LISFVQAGQIRRGLDATRLRASIFQSLEVSARKREKEEALAAETEAETERAIST